MSIRAEFAILLALWVIAFVSLLSYTI